MTAPVRLVLKDPEEAGGLRGIADHEGWINTAAVTATADRPLELVWTVDEFSLVRYVEDQNARFAYVQLEGPQASRLAGRFRDVFDLWTSDEIAVLADGNEDDAARAAMLAGLSAPAAPDDRYAPILERSLGNRSPAVRARAVEALAYPAWPTLAPRLALLAREDPDAQVRELAGRLAAILSGGAA